MVDVIKLGVGLDTSNLKTGTEEIEDLGNKAIITGKKLNSMAVETEKASKKIANDLMPNRFNTANIAAQFQDIAVTASMGMNPLLVAMQQGTQVAAIMNSMQSPLRGLAEAFKQVINPISLMSIALTALAVAGLQMVDWVSVGKSALNGLASVVENVVPILLKFGVVLAGLYVFMNAGTIAAFTVSMVRLGAVALMNAAKFTVMWAAANPAVLIAGALTALLAFSENARSVVNGMIGFFVGMFQILQTKITGMLNTMIEGWNYFAEKMGKTKIKLFDVDQRSSGKILEDAMNYKYVEKAASAIDKATTSAANSIRKFASTLGQETGKEKKDPWAELVAGAERKIATFKSQADAINLTGEAALRLKYTTDLLNEAQQKHIKPSEEQTKKIYELAAALASVENTAKQMKAWKEFTEGTDKKVAALEAEGKALGLVGYQAAEFKYQTELLAEAKQKELDLTPERLAFIDEEAKKMANLSVANDNYRQGLEFTRSTSKSFITDMINGLSQGRSAWQSFGNAVLNVLNKIFDKLIDTGLNTMFGGTGTSGIASLFGNLFGGLSGSTSTSTVGNNYGLGTGTGGLYAKGGSFSSGTSLSNGIYSSPTMFQFANGGSFGVMGEAGPEAVMPLKRGSDGSLGVALNDNSGGGGGVVVNVYNNSNASASVNQRQTSRGIELDVMIDNIVSEKLGTQGTATNTALNSYQSRKLIQR